MENKTAVVIRNYSERNQFLHRVLATLRNQSFDDLIICLLNLNNKPINTDLYQSKSIDDIFDYLRAKNVRYISVIDDDDTLSPEFFSRTISVMKNISIPSVKAITTHTNKVMELCEGNRIRVLTTEPLNHHLNYGILALDTLRYRDALRLSSCVFEFKEFVDSCYRHDLRHPSFFWPFIIDFGSKFDIWLLAEAMGFYHVREQSEFNSNNYSIRHAAEADIYIRAQLNQLYRSSSNEPVLSGILQKLIFS